MGKPKLTREDLTQSNRGHVQNLESLRRKMSDRIEDVRFVETENGVKMSEVLERFIQPYMYLAETEADMAKLVGLAVVAWNASLMPEKKRSELINGTVGALPREAQADVRQSIADLIERKKRHFAKIRRIVVDYESKETAGEFHLAVASVPYEA
jgi:hypothetical protein